METFQHVFQCAMKDMSEEHPAVQMAGKWNEKFFGNDHPIVLELGCGRGEYTIGLAQLYPDKNFIGIDIKGARLWAGAKQAEEKHMDNVAFLRTNIEMISQFFSTDEISEIWITFPDPQMKKETKRLTSTYFMKRYQQIMADGGIIHLKTDSPFLSTYTREMLHLNHYEVLADTQDLYAEGEQGPWEQARMLQTHYEQQWLSRGMKIKYICWKLKHSDTLEEPDIEIEKDDYRSYGRNYVSSTNH